MIINKKLTLPLEPLRRKGLKLYEQLAFALKDERKLKPMINNAGYGHIIKDASLALSELDRKEILQWHENNIGEMCSVVNTSGLNYDTTCTYYAKNPNTDALIIREHLPYYPNSVLPSRLTERPKTVVGKKLLHRKRWGVPYKGADRLALARSRMQWLVPELISMLVDAQSWEDEENTIDFSSSVIYAIGQIGGHENLVIPFLIKSLRTYYKSLFDVKSHKKQTKSFVLLGDYRLEIIYALRKYQKKIRPYKDELEDILYNDSVCHVSGSRKNLDKDLMMCVRHFCGRIGNIENRKTGQGTYKGVLIVKKCRNDGKLYYVLANGDTVEVDTDEDWDILIF